MTDILGGILSLTFQCSAAQPTRSRSWSQLCPFLSFALHSCYSLRLLSLIQIIKMRAKSIKGQFQYIFSIWFKVVCRTVDNVALACRRLSQFFCIVSLLGDECVAFVIILGQVKGTVACNCFCSWVVATIYHLWQRWAN